jgi:uncharacterized protein (DUF58 family)
MPVEGLRFLDPKVLAKIRSLELKAKYVVEGFMSGLHRSPYKGFSVEFAEYRQYMPGDEIRYIDWRVFGRSDKFFIKEFEEETNLRCYLTIDISESMGYKSKKSALTKLEYASYLAASLAYFMTQQRDGAGLVTLDNDIRDFMPASMKTGHLHSVLVTLERIKLGGASNMAPVLHNLAEMYVKRGLVCLISDLLDDVDGIVKALKHFRFRGHEVIIFHILDYDELEFPFTGLTKFEEMETKNELITLPDALRQSYLKQLNSFISKYKEECLTLDIDYVLLNTSKPLDFALMQYLAKRSGLM